MKISYCIVFIIFLSSCAEVPKFDGQKSYDYVKTQIDFGPRNPGSKGHIEFTKWLVNFFKSTDASVKFQSFKWTDERFNKSYNMNNIIVSFYPEKRNRVLLAAHFDTNPISEKDKIEENKLKPVLGANDGASGVAVLLQIAEILNKNEANYGVDIVLFDGEDLGDAKNPDNYCLGSKHFAKTMKNYKPQFGILLDMVGHKTAQFRYELNSLYRQESFLKSVWTKAEELGYGHLFLKEKGLAINDDHVPLLEAGISIIDIIDMDVIEGKDDTHHTQNDVLDYISAETLEAVGNVVLHMIYD